MIFAAKCRDYWDAISMRAGRATNRPETVDRDGFNASVSDSGGVVWSAFGPREDEKRPQTMRTSERQTPKGHKAFRRMVGVARTP